MMQRQMIQQQERNQYSNRAGIYDGKIAGLYDLEETLGSGHFAVVKLARHVFTGEKVAVKVIDKTKLDEVSKAHLFQEVRCMKLVQHPHVVRLYEVIDTQTKLYLILELGDGGDLYDYIMRHETGLSETLAREYFRQIVRAISYCHQLHVVHRDLKPENVVFFEKLGVVKLTDFGFSNKFCPGQKLETSCGSLAYSAPEILLGDSYDAPAVDVWSLGVILFMLVCGQPPFQEANDSETLTMIMDCKYTMPDHVSSGCRKLISSMLVREPEKRASLQQIASDKWLIEGSNSPTQQHQPEHMPLVSREQVSEEDHSLIIQKMVNGNIAQKDEILEALDKNEYNHITATYFLLAERKLRAHRQDQIQQSKKKPDLSLPLSSPTAAARNQSLTMNQDEQDSNLLLVPGMSASRTPGAESGQKGRNRKCSIVAEEEDDDEDPEPSSPLNRRGSRSEGRINITVQDRLSAEVTERLKKEKVDTESSSKPKVGLIDGIAGIKIIRNDSSKEKFLGQAGAGNRKDIRSSSVDKAKPPTSRGQGEVKFLTESSTISIPAISVSSSSSNPIAKPYKTMPSPSRPSAISNNAGTNCLKEIFEECDAGSSDNNSNTNTPRAILRSQANATHHRRTKFHKSRTTSGSSTDGSDDDNAEKKRATKIIDCTIVKPFTQRRDSHDDSSDSQDPGTTCSTSNSNAGSSLLLRNGSTSNNKPSSQTGESNHDDRGKTTSNSSEIGYRKHRSGRRRQTETRLRESQSLNRITEVQECEHSNGAHFEKSEKSKDFEEDVKSSRVAVLNQLNAKHTDTIVNATNELKANKNHNNSKAKGFSARFLQNFKRSHDVTSGTKNLQKSNRNSMEVPSLKNNAQNLRNPTQMTNDGSDRSKKIKILGRYFQVHKKICQPLSGLFRNSGNARLSSNLYKAQSCSSIIRDGIHHPNTINNNTLSTSSSEMNKNSTKLDEKLIGEREYLIKNCLSSRFIGSDGDINDAVTEKSLEKQQQLLDYIDDDILSGSKC